MTTLQLDEKSETRKRPNARKSELVYKNYTNQKQILQIIENNSRKTIYHFLDKHIGQ